jgi:hypothetical protein
MKVYLVDDSGVFDLRGYASCTLLNWKKDNKAWIEYFLSFKKLYVLKTLCFLRASFRNILWDIHGYFRTPTNIFGLPQISSESLGCLRTPSDVFGHPQISSDSFRYLRAPPDTFRHHQTFPDVSMPFRARISSNPNHTPTPTLGIS